MTLVNAVATGVLVGCVLGIILPEGFETMCEAKGVSASPWLLAGYTVQVLLDLAGQRLRSGDEGGHHHSHHHHHYHVLGKHSPMPLTGDLERFREGDEEAACVCLHEDGDEEEEDETAAAATIELPVMHQGGGPESPIGASGSLNIRSPRRQSSVTFRSDSHDMTGAGAIHYPAHRNRAAPGVTSTCCRWPFSCDFCGLLVHCVADGVALGASSLSSSAALRSSVFLALTLHKLPVAFATGAVVHHALSLSTTTTRPQSRSKGRSAYLFHALAFALASPLAALLTHGAARLAKGAEGEGDGGAAAIGGLLLFSGGSFLHVAIGHLAPEFLHSSHLWRSGPRAWLLLCLLVGGMAVVPLLAALAPEEGQGAHGHRV